jgi:hypothetical protein
MAKPCILSDVSMIWLLTPAKCLIVALKSLNYCTYPPYKVFETKRIKGTK